ncbi:MAG: hypothetical protein WAW11_00180 [Patescibacteria group bacterium]
MSISNEEYNYNEEIDGNDDYPDIEDLASRIDDLENNQIQTSNNNYNNCMSLLYIPGLVLAMILSYDFNRSIFWAILHGCLSWVYVIYRALF